jgi:hypothetical protein
MNRVAAAVVIALIALSLGTAQAAAAAVRRPQGAVSASEALESAASEQLSQLDTGDIERFLRQVDDDVAKRMPAFDARSCRDRARNEQCHVR